MAMSSVWPILLAWHCHTGISLASRAVQNDGGVKVRAKYILGRVGIKANLFCLEADKTCSSSFLHFVIVSCWDQISKVHYMTMHGTNTTWITHFLLLVLKALYWKIHIVIHSPLHVEFYCMVLGLASRKRKWWLLICIVLSYLHIRALELSVGENFTLITSFSIWHELLLNRVHPMSSHLQGECSIGLCFPVRPVGFFFSATVIFCP